MRGPIERLWRSDEKEFSITKSCLTKGKTKLEKRITFLDIDENDQKYIELILAFESNGY